VIESNCQHRQIARPIISGALCHALRHCKCSPRPRRSVTGAVQLCGSGVSARHLLQSATTSSRRPIRHIYPVSSAMDVYGMVASAVGIASSSTLFLDPISVASNVAALLSLTVRITSALYGYWDPASRPSAQRLLYQLACLRISLESLERISLESEGPMPLYQLPAIFRGLRKVLIQLRSKLVGDGESLDVPGQNILSATWIMYQTEKQLTSLPMSKVDSEYVFNQLQIYVDQLRKM
jgi:hypothetical protein